MAETRSLRVVCPECSADLVIDAATGEILHHRKANLGPAGGKSFDALMQGLEEDRSRAEEIFERERAAVKDRDRLLRERFEEAMRNAGDLDDVKPPPRPFDLD
jgi:hypothetical protein